MYRMLHKILSCVGGPAILDYIYVLTCWIILLTFLFEGFRILNRLWVLICKLFCVEICCVTWVPSLTFDIPLLAVVNICTFRSHCSIYVVLIQYLGNNLLHNFVHLKLSVRYFSLYWRPRMLIVKLLSLHIGNLPLISINSCFFNLWDLGVWWLYLM